MKRGLQVGAVLLGPLMLTASLSSAQHMNAKDAPCRAPSSTVEETDCFAAAWKKSDSDLNETYRRVEGVVEGDDLADLRAAQRQWIQFRDSNCEAEHRMYFGGTAASMVKLACLEAMTRHRTEELKTMYGWRLEKWER